MAHLVSGSWSHEQCQARVPFHGVGLKYRQQRGLTIHLWEATYSYGNSLNFGDISIGPFWSITQLDTTHSWHWKFFLVAKDV